MSLCKCTTSLANRGEIKLIDNMATNEEMIVGLQLEAENKAFLNTENWESAL